MSAEIEVSAPSMLGSISSLKTTPLVMHRIYFEVCNEKTWYALMSEARTWFGKEWKTQSHVRRKFDKHVIETPVTLWFDVPDARFGTWIAVKLAVRVVEPPNK